MPIKTTWPKTCQTCGSPYGPKQGYSTECRRCYAKRLYRESPQHRENLRRNLARWLSKKKMADPAWAEDYRRRVCLAGVKWRAKKRSEVLLTS